MEFSDIAIQLNTERRQSHLLERHGFKKNKRGLMQKSISTMFSIRTRTGLKPAEAGYLCYADQDPNEQRPEAELIRSKIWKQEHVGRLWAYIGGRAMTLVQVTPAGVNSLKGGFITQEGGLCVIDEK